MNKFQWFLVGILVTLLTVLVVSLYDEESDQQYIPVGTKTNGQSLLWNSETGRYK